MGTHTRHSGLLACAAVALLVAVMLGAAAAPRAAAAPIDPTMTLERLQELLDASPSGVPATFKTVVKGSTIETIPCTILGIVPGAAYDNGPLIMFQATGPIIEATGGIASGMSGSPVYVDDGGTQTLAGAVSYGSDFTTNGYGLATPIESMETVEDSLAPPGDAVRVALPEPIRGDGRVIDHVVIAQSHAAVNRFMGRPGTLVMSPRGLVEVSGIPANSRVFKNLQHRMATRGVDVIAARTGSASQSDFTTDLVPGASVGALQTRGDVWYGGIGTVTYTTPEGGLVAFGHPMVWDGRVAYYMTNADVVGTWSSSWASFKMAVPGAVRGTITRDAGAGVAGPIDLMPEEVPVTTTATDVDTGKTVTSVSYGTAWIMDNYTYSGIAAFIAYPALYRATDDAWFEGTVRYTLTLQVGDGTDDYVVSRSNTWDDDWDASSWAIMDMWSVFDRLLANRDGLAPAYIAAVGVDATLTREHERATIADVQVPGGLVVGDNTAHVTLWDYGDPDPRQLDVTFTIPEGMSTQGSLSAGALEGDVYLQDEYFGDFYDNGGLPPARQSLGEVIDDIAALPSNEDLQLVFRPDGREGDVDDATLPEEIAASQASGAYLMGGVEKRTSRQRLFGTRIRHGARATVHGILRGCSGETRVEVYKQAVGSANRVYVGQANVRRIHGPRSPWMFTARLGRLTRSTRVTTVWNGDDDYIGSTGRTKVRVASRRHD